jgi:hypothetical protein
MTILEKCADFAIPKEPECKNRALHLLEVFTDKCGLGNKNQINDFELLVSIRNCILHNSGILRDDKFEASIRERVLHRSDFRISNWHFVGECIEINKGAIESRTVMWRDMVYEIYRASFEKRLMKSNG